MANELVARPFNFYTGLTDVVCKITTRTGGVVSGGSAVSCAETGTGTAIYTGTMPGGTGAQYLVLMFTSAEVGGDIYRDEGYWTGSAWLDQTGDSYARLGAPAGASHAADTAAVKSDTDAIKAKTDYLPSATAGAAGGVFIAGSNAATTVNFTGSLSGSVGSVTGAVGSVTSGVVVTTNNDKTGYSLVQSFPANFASLSINASGHVSRVTLADTVTTYTGNTPQTGDAYSRIGAAGAGLTAIGDTRMAYLDATVSSRMATFTYTAPDNTGIGNIYAIVNHATYGNAHLALSSQIPASFTAGTFSSAGVFAAAALANAPTGGVGITAADVWGYTSRTITGGEVALTSDYDAAKTAASSAEVAAVPGLVWDEPIAGHVDSGTTGNALNAAGSAGDPWSTEIPGAYGAGSAGYILGHNIDTAISGAVAPLATTVDLAALSASVDSGFSNIPDANANADALLATTQTDLLAYPDDTFAHGVAKLNIGPADTGTSVVPNPVGGDTGQVYVWTRNTVIGTERAGIQIRISYRTNPAKAGGKAIETNAAELLTNAEGFASAVIPLTTGVVPSGNKYVVNAPALGWKNIEFTLEAADLDGNGNFDLAGLIS